MTGGVRSLLMTLVLWLPATPWLSAQSAAGDRPRIWAAGGFGDGRSGWDGDLNSILLEFVYQRGHTQFALRGVAVSTTYTDEPSYNETGLLYGRTFLGGLGHATVGSGLAVVKACEDGDTCTWTLGLPLVSEAALRPFPVIGLGVQAFANLNGQASFGGLVLFLQAGWMPFGPAL
jgi:hypothetical protein